MIDNYDLERFVKAQRNNHLIALFEIKKGKKMNHWMWYVFPQLKGLGRSSTAIFYAIKSKQEAITYLKHPILGKRLLEISNELLKVENRNSKDIFGWTDALKLKSSMTLFAAIQTKEKVFREILIKFYDCKECLKTIEMLQQDNEIK
ncbi:MULTISPECIES: DUF1810 domain-containing protein [unclassified Polaribacter]|uniref:DUF1810 domain-containing protein n=1 Tax=unclassified Polaribacter TaxID=196858 RepID=UPI0011BE1C84|nr:MULTISPECIES: DUF1810 domain-containing protein [unclassified Polaribacter]TXD49481.1 DUF1810 domain-containing protein [Polaribacter sp. IC063]TXD56034.1 DUF1810 domain-containing protein [Polaribacter sp. IC066]